MASVVLLYDRFHPQLGGMERMIAELARSLAERHRVTVLARSARSLPTSTRHGSVEVARCRWWSGSARRWLAGKDVVIGFGYTPYSARCLFPLAVAMQARAAGAHLAWCPTYYPAEPGAAARRPGWKGLLPPRARAALRSLAADRYHDLFQSCDAIFALTEVEREHWSAALPGRAVHLCPHGVSVEHGSCTDRASAESRLRQRYGAGPMIASIGRISAHKNQAVLIDAMPLIQRRSPTARLLLVGSDAGAEAASLRRRAAGLPNRDAVVFTGPLSDAELCDVYAGSLCVAHPSRHEASGLTPLEAIAHGTPAVHSGQGALARFDLLAGCQTVDSLTDPVAWSEAILRCLEEAGEWRRQAAMGRATVLSHHTWQAMGARIATEVEAFTGDAVSSTAAEPMMA